MSIDINFSNIKCQLISILITFNKVLTYNL